MGSTVICSAGDIGISRDVLVLWELRISWKVCWLMILCLSLSTLPFYVVFALGYASHISVLPDASLIVLLTRSAREKWEAVFYSMLFSVLVPICQYHLYSGSGVDTTFQFSLFTPEPVSWCSLRNSSSSQTVPLFMGLSASFTFSPLRCWDSSTTGQQLLKKGLGPTSKRASSKL